MQQLAHTGTHNGHDGFAALGQSLGEFADDRIVSHGHDGRKVQDLAQLAGTLFGQPRSAVDTGAGLTLTWGRTRLGLPVERWQILAAMARAWEAAGDDDAAQPAREQALAIVRGLAATLTDEADRKIFLNGAAGLI